MAFCRIRRLQWTLLLLGLVACAPLSVDSPFLHDDAAAEPSDAGPDARPTDCCTSTSTDDSGAELSLDAAAPVDPDSLTVRVAQGVVEGARKLSIRVFHGIPYAAAPIGARRFAPPAPPEPWPGTRMAQTAGPSCMQPEASAPGPKSEDCLTLDVYAPAAAQQGRPVMVFFHGGGFGGGGAVSTPSEWLSEAGQAVIVTVNYRLGRLGFLTHSALDAVLDVPSGNMGLRDQQRALAWVRQNIAAFGGAPDNVTAFGESAGSVAMSLHLFAKGSEGLADRLILESGSCLAGPFILRSREEALSTSRTLVDQLCAGKSDTLDCLRSLPASAFVPASEGDAGTYRDWAALPHLDGQLFEAMPLTQLRAGHFQRLPVIIGTNAREASFYEAYGVPPVNNKLDMSLLILLAHPDVWSTLTEHYTPASDVEAREAAMRAITDYQFRCASRLLARQLAAHDLPVYLYNFNVWPAAHAQELDYVFGWPCCGLSSKLAGAPYPTLRSVIELVQGYWLDFARTGDPNGGARPLWPRYERGQDLHMVLSDEPGTSADAFAADCDWWEAQFAL